MTARALRWLLGILSIAAAGWFMICLRAGAPVRGIIGASVILLVHAWILGVEFACAWMVNRTDPAPRASVRQVIVAWWHEVWSDVVVFAWRQAFCSARIPDRYEGTRRRGVVLVHGFFCNRGIFGPWLAKLSRRDIPYLAINLPELFGSIDDCVPVLDDAVSKMFRATNHPPVIVAHSMGGLVVRAWLDAARADARIHHVITIGTPHGGTWLARFAFAVNTRQMRRSGAWLNAMQAREPASRAARFTCFYSNCDNIVFPASTATLPGADNRHLPAKAHVEMVYDTAVLTEAIRLLDVPPVVDSSIDGPAETAR